MNRVVRGGETRKRSTCKVSHTFQERNEFVGVGGKYFCLVSLSVDKGKKFILFREKFFREKRFAKRSKELKR